MLPIKTESKSILKMSRLDQNSENILKHWQNSPGMSLRKCLFSEMTAKAKATKFVSFCTIGWVFFIAQTAKETEAIVK